MPGDIRNSSIINEVDKYIKRFWLSDDAIDRISNELLEAFYHGLENDDTQCKMLSTFIPRLDSINHDEVKSYLSIDLGGTNLRCLKVNFQKGVETEVIFTREDVPLSVRVSNNETKLFGFIADTLAAFITSLSGSHSICERVKSTNIENIKNEINIELLDKQIKPESSEVNNTTVKIVKPNNDVVEPYCDDVIIDINTENILPSPTPISPSTSSLLSVNSNSNESLDENNVVSPDIIDSWNYLSTESQKNQSIDCSILSNDFEIVNHEISTIQQNDSQISDDRQIAVGFTFSFPIIQSSAISGYLPRWTKDYDIPEALNKCVIQLLQTEIDQRGINAKVVVLLNDTVGTLLSGMLQSKDAAFGLIVGTGCNACYLEEACNIPRLKDSLWCPNTKMIINCEWGSYDSISLSRTEFDIAVDESSPNPGYQIFEKLISGMYLGEILRRTLLDMFSKQIIFQNQELAEIGAIPTEYMSLIEGDLSPELNVINDVLNRLSITSILWDRTVVKEITGAIGERSARLVAAGVIALHKKTGREHSVTAAFDGSIYKLYPYFQARMWRAIEAQTKNTHGTINCVSIHDGSGIGAAAATTSYC